VRIGSDVREIEIERDQISSFGAASLQQRLIRSAGQLLIRNGVGVMPQLVQRFADELWQVLVKLELHPMLTR